MLSATTPDVRQPAGLRLPWLDASSTPPRFTSSPKSAVDRINSTSTATDTTGTAVRDAEATNLLQSLQCQKLAAHAQYSNTMPLFNTRDRATAALAFLSKTKQLPTADVEAFFTSSLAVDDSFQDDDWTCSGFLIEELDTCIIARHSVRSGCKEDGEDGSSYAYVDIEIIEPAAPPQALGGCNNQGEVLGVRRRGSSSSSSSSSSSNSDGTSSSSNAHGTIASEVAGSATDSNISKKPTCSHCGDVLDRDSSLWTKCQGGCMTTKFCNRFCQKQNWKGGHKKICKAMRENPYSLEAPKRFTLATLKGGNSIANGSQMLVLHSRALTGIKKTANISKLLSSADVLSLIVFAIFRDQTIASTGEPALGNIQLCPQQPQPQQQQQQQQEEGGSGEVGMEFEPAIMPIMHEVMAVCRLPRKGNRMITLQNGMKCLNAEGSPMHTYTGQKALLRV